jgi:hypothetical protein
MRVNIEEFIERYYNWQRLRSAQGYRVFQSMTKMRDKFSRLPSRREENSNNGKCALRKLSH